MPLFAFFLIISLMEIAVFIVVGDEIGLLWTLLLCVLTALIGSFLIRIQGAVVLVQGMENMRSGHLPLESLFDGFCLAIAGALLLTPGFVTDSLGFALLYPPTRKYLRGELGKRFNMRGPHGGASGQGFRPANDVIEGEYEEIKDKDKNDPV